MRNLLLSSASPQGSDRATRSDHARGEETSFAGFIPTNFYSTRQLAEATGFTVEFYETMRYRNEGPDWITVNKRAVRYLGSSVIAWLKGGVRSPIKDGAHHDHA